MTTLTALFFNTTASNNIAIGFEANVSAGNLTSATAIGADVVVDATNKTRLGNTFVTVIEGQVALSFLQTRPRRKTSSR